MLAFDDCQPSFIQMNYEVSSFIASERSVFYPSPVQSLEQVSAKFLESKTIYGVELNALSVLRGLTTFGYSIKRLLIRLIQQRLWYHNGPMYAFIVTSYCGPLYSGSSFYYGYDRTD